MAYTIAFEPFEFRIVATIYEKVNTTELIEFINEILIHVTENHCFFLLISFEMAALAITVSEFYELTKAIFTAVEKYGLKKKKFFNAITGSKDQDFLYLYEMITRGSNNGINVFHQIDEAKKWLQKAQNDYFSEKH